LNFYWQFLIRSPWAKFLLKKHVNFLDLKRNFPTFACNSYLKNPNMQKHNFLPLIIVVFAMLPSLLFGQKDEVQIGALNQQSVPGTSIKMNIPTVYVWDGEQQAYIYAGAAASISFRQINGTSGAQLAKSMSETLKKDAKLQSITTTNEKTKAGIEATQFITTYSVSAGDQDKKTEFERIVFICGNEQNSVWVSVNYPVVTRSLLSEVLKNCLLSLEF
jgi:hypothetical protein